MSDNNVMFTQEEVSNILGKLQTLTFNIADCIGLLKYYNEPDSKRDIIKDTLFRDLDYLARIESLVKMKLNKGD
jgi:hypothetical protein